MRKAILAVFGIVIIAGLGYATVTLSGSSGSKISYGWRYKMTVTVETPEGLVTGSAVRQMGNSAQSINIPDVGNPADVRGEAVVVDMGERGVLFALISYQSDLEFYNAFPAPNGGGSTLEGIRHYASLPVGTKGILNPKNPPGYPKLVTFTDMNDPKSVTLAQRWNRNDRGYYYLAEEYMEELFGEGVKLKEITMEITDEPVMWGVVDKYLPNNFYEVIVKNWGSLTNEEQSKLFKIVTFKQGEPK